MAVGWHGKHPAFALTSRLREIESKCSDAEHNTCCDLFAPNAKRLRRSVLTHYACAHPLLVRHSDLF